MKHRPHKFTFRIALRIAAVFAASALFTPHGAAQEAAPDGEPAAAAEPVNAGSATSVATELDALTVLKEVRDRLESLQFLQCELYETVDLSSLRFQAAGTYAQASGNRVRLEFRIFPIRGVRRDDAETLKLDGEPQDLSRQKPTGELVQVSDGNALWSYWKNGSSRRLTRRNIQEILAAANQSPTMDSGRLFEDLGTGGLQALLARLEAGMEFGKVREQVVGENTRLLILSGRWTRESLQRYFRIQDPEAPRPQWIPDYVRVYVDAEARLPRRIQYLKKHPNPEVKQVRPLIQLDLRAMTVNDEVDEQLFRFEAPPGVAELDLTEQMIESIQKAANPGSVPVDQPSPAEADPAAEPASSDS